MTNLVSASKLSFVAFVLLVSPWSRAVTGNTTVTEIPDTTTQNPTTSTTSTPIPTTWLLNDSCCYGNTTLQHGETVLELPGCCMRLLCCFGAIVTSNRLSGIPVHRDHDPCHQDHDDHIWDNTTMMHSRYYDASYSSCCVLGDRMYPPGYILTTFCLRMVCHDGHWDFAWSIDPTCGHCWLHDYPHFTTFDGYNYNWYGRCNYTLAQTNDSSDPHTAVYVSFKKCFRRRRALGMPVCLSLVTFRENSNSVIELDADNSTAMTVNGEVVEIPDTHDLKRVTTSHGLHPVLALKIFGCPTLIGASGFVVMQCQHRVDVWVSKSLAGLVDGLCGPFNVNHTDDSRIWERGYERYNTTLFPLLWLAEDENRLKCHNNDPDINNAAKCTQSKERFVYECERSTRGNQYLSETCQYDLCKLTGTGRPARRTRRLIRKWLRVVSRNAYITKMIANATNTTQEYIYQ